MAAMSDLEGMLLTRLAESSLGEAETDILLGALLGTDELSQVLGGTPPRRPDLSTAAESSTVQQSPAGAYLKSITVSGFRGIGPATTLALDPGPGLTVVCGRNGSGKSSFAEALEVLLTGTIRRFEDRSAVWKDTWRCLHGTATEVSAELVVEGVKGAAVVTRTWVPTAKQVTEGDVRVRVPGETDSGIARLGWYDALTLYRPFLSHSELEVLLARPADLYDQLNSLLGLEELAEIAARLAAARKQTDDTIKAAKDQLPALRQALEGCADERARAGIEILQEKKADLDGLEALAAGGPVPDAGELALLTRLKALNVPSPANVEGTRRDLIDAADRLEQVGASAAGDASATADLLAAAVDHFRRHGPEDCPVCGRPGALDDNWMDDTSARIEGLQAQAEEMQQATSAAESAAQTARLLNGSAPEALPQAGTVGIDPIPATEAWSAWTAQPAAALTPSGLRAVADHLAVSHHPLHQAVDDLANAAAAELEGRQDRWASVASSLSAWCATERAARSVKDTVDRIKRVEQWLKDANDDLRNARLRPFAEGTAELWSKLRQESNVDLVKMTLIGSATRRAVDFEVTVDGNPATGLGVMSQGEVNALALSVFLPRATADASPLRFVVIDDPVQAMDPSKVDGMAKVFTDAAATRQVVVFTHDDRLPAAIRQLDLPARIVQVTRRSESVVEIHPAGDPCEQLLREAGSLAADNNVPFVVAARVVPGLCRIAIEAACFEITRGRRLGRGDDHNSVETALLATTKLMPRLALAIFDNPDRGGEVYTWLNQQIAPWAADTARAANEGSHGGPNTAMGPLVGDTRNLIERLRAKLS